MSDTKTNKLKEHVEVPEAKEGEKGLVDTHNHTYDTTNFVTHVNISDSDVKVGDRTGRPQYVITPSGVRERYRPSDKGTEAERKTEGGILERCKDGQWQRIPGANTDTKNPGAYRNGY